jgi:hypothetical protein
MSAIAWPATLQQAIVYFSDPDRAHAAMVKFRWPDGIVRCPTCGSAKVWFTASRRIWQCREDHPRRQFSVKVGSIMEDSPLGIDKWLVALWLINNCKNGVSSYEIARDLGVTQKTAWFMLHRIRLAMQSDDGGKLGGYVEVDETYIGGKARNMSASKKRRLGINPRRSMAGKVAVMGLLERHPEKGMSKMRLRGLDGTRRHQLLGHVSSNVAKGSTVNTDALRSYLGLTDAGFVHKVIDHAEAYVDGQVHTNGCENFWSLLKRALKGTYVSVEPFHLFRYLDEQCFRFNTRKLSDTARFGLTAAAVFGKRLTFKELTAADQTC